MPPKIFESANDSLFFRKKVRCANCGCLVYILDAIPYFDDVRGPISHRCVMCMARLWGSGIVPVGT